MGEYEAAFQNQPVDISGQFARQENHFFLGEKVESFDPLMASGEIIWKSLSLKQRVSYHQLTLQFEDYKVWEDTPPGEYEDDQVLPFDISFVSPRTVRLRVAARREPIREKDSLMLVGEPGSDGSWEMSDEGGRVTYTAPHGSVVVEREPFHFEFRDASGRLLTRTNHLSDTRSVVNSMPTPFSFVRNASNLHRHIAASFKLSPGEKLFGGGESFTRLDKRGQKMVLYTYDAYSAQTPYMYKPVPFFMSDRGYGMFVHTSAPLTFDLGGSYDGANVIYLGDDFLDLFVFIGSPKEILTEYTALTGRAPTPPLWSFGLWMGRESYSSEQETREVARKLREHRIPSDVIHLDTDWTETPHRCDYEFSPSRFPTAEKMLSDLREDGFRVSLWQLPYLNPMNELHAEAIEKDLVVLSANGKEPVDDAVIDLGKPEAVEWYQGKLKKLLEKGVGVFTADFGEAAPLSGIYAARHGGFHEHNLYPLRYNKAVAEITEEVNGYGVIFARSGWAGSQRYPLHWGGDAENTDTALAATLRAGLSLGLCGFSFWSHFIGGFAYQSPADLYLRWLAFGMFCSHSRCHGAPPREPWEYGKEFMDGFRRIVETKYRLMPYVYAQARLCSERGHPMIRPLFFEFPEDRTSWLIEDEYLFGEDILVAPRLEDAPGRDVYLPPGFWIDYQTGEVYEGARWHDIRAGDLPIVLLVRDGAAIPHAGLAQSTEWIDWSEIELRVYGAETRAARGLFCLPEDGESHVLRLAREGGSFTLAEDPLPHRVRWSVNVYP
ncbi:MAG TPA: TIM-barrel domain-containing protein [Rubrobacteraceae bacterium]|nr:TIM-barrel domain-containing protein [Rubrobacteraceae bacterium]